jgi:ABC-2 type transport system ATP-binding protein
VEWSAAWKLAQALVNAPRLLVLDEPTVGLDPIARADVWEYIAGLRESSQMTVLMTTHHMDEADKHDSQEGSIRDIRRTRRAARRLG